MLLPHQLGVVIRALLRGDVIRRAARLEILESFATGISDRTLCADYALLQALPKSRPFLTTSGARVQTSSMIWS